MDENTAAMVSKLDGHLASMAAMVTQLEETLKQNGNFLFGDKPSAADYLIWPHVERLPVAQMMFGKLQEAIAREKFTVFYAWVDRMLADDAVKATGRTAQQHFESTKKYLAGEHVYDLDGKDYTIHARKE